MSSSMHARTSRGTCPVCRKASRGDGLKVFVRSACPICMDTHDTVAAMECGHVLCHADFDRLAVSHHQLSQAPSD